MIRFNRVVIALVLCTVSACSDSSNTDGDRQLIDYTGTWTGLCRLADISEVLDLGDIYYHDTLEFTETNITTGASIFSDSDCVNTFVAAFMRNAAFDQGEYTVGERIGTETGLTAYVLRIQDSESGSTFDNIIALVQETLYFGFNPVDGPSDITQNSLRALDLENGFTRQ